jgi:hypothetical protein
MKQLLTVLLLVGALTAAKAQGNLQFNQVIFLEKSIVLPANISSSFTEQSITVPAGKVWKIESVMASFFQNTATPNPSFSTSGTVMLNKKIIFSTGNVASFPIWLPEGTYTIRYIYNNSTSGSINELYGAISAIEFNVIP